MTDESMKPPIYRDGTLGVDFPLPCFEEQGSLQKRLEEGRTVREAFQEHADMFEECARLCRRMTQALDEMPTENLTVCSDGYSIGIVAPLATIEVLAAKGLLERDPFREEEDRRGVKEELQNLIHALLIPDPGGEDVFPGVTSGPATVQTLMGVLEAAGPPMQGLHPQFLEEVLTDLVERGTVLCEQGVYHVNPNCVPYSRSDEDSEFDW